MKMRANLEKELTSKGYKSDADASSLPSEEPGLPSACRCQTATVTAAAGAVVTALTRKCISVDRGRDRAALRRGV